MPRVTHRRYDSRQIAVEDLSIRDTLWLATGAGLPSESAVDKLLSIEDGREFVLDHAAALNTMRTPANERDPGHNLHHEAGRRLWAWWKWLSPQPRDSERWPDQLDQLRAMGVLHPGEEQQHHDAQAERQRRGFARF